MNSVILIFINAFCIWVVLDSHQTSRRYNRNARLGFLGWAAIIFATLGIITSMISMGME